MMEDTHENLVITNHLYGAVETVSSKQQPWLSCVQLSPGHLCYNLVHTSRIFKDEFIGTLLQPCLQ